MSALLALQAALVGRLVADAPLMAVATGVYDGRAPQGATLPYVVVGEPTEIPSGNLGPQGWNDTIAVHIWSGYAGRKEALEILELMDTALAAPLVLSGHTTARLRREFVTALVEETGVRHVPIRYRILTFEA